MSWFKKDKTREPAYTIKVERSHIDKGFLGIIYKGDSFAHRGMVFAPTAELAEARALDWIQDDLSMKCGWTTKVYVEGWFLPFDPDRKHFLSTERSRS